MTWNAANDPQEHITDQDGLSDAPWRFEQAPNSDPRCDSLTGWILPHGADEDDPCVAYVENVGAVDLAIMLTAPEMLAALESVYVDLVDYSKRLSGSYDTGAVALGSCADQVWVVIQKAKGERP